MKFQLQILADAKCLAIFFSFYSNFDGYSYSNSQNTHKFTRTVQLFKKIIEGFYYQKLVDWGGCGGRQRNLASTCPRVLIMKWFVSFD